MVGFPGGRAKPGLLLGAHPCTPQCVCSLAGFLRPPWRWGHREGSSLWQAAPGSSPRGSREGTQITPLVRWRRSWKRVPPLQTLSVMGGTGEGKRGPGAGDEVQPPQKGRSGWIKAGSEHWQCCLCQAGSRRVMANGIQRGRSSLRLGFSLCAVLCQCFLQLLPHPRHKFLAGKQLLFPAGLFPGAKHQQYPRGAPKGASTPSKLPVGAAPAACEPNVLPPHHIQEKGPEAVSAQHRTFLSGRGRNLLFLHGQRRNFTNFHWHLLLRFPLLKPNLSHAEASGAFTLCQPGKPKSYSEHVSWEEAPPKEAESEPLIPSDL